MRDTHVPFTTAIMLTSNVITVYRQKQQKPKTPTRPREVKLLVPRLYSQKVAEPRFTPGMSDLTDQRSVVLLRKRREMEG